MVSVKGVPMDIAETGPFDLASQRLGALPLVDHFLDRAGLPALLGRYLPAADARVRSAPAVAVRLVVTNLLIGRQPLYALGEWAAPFGPGLLGLADDEAGAINDDRVGRALEALFDADRASLLTELILGVVREFGVDTAELHNDSTSISVHGVYRDATGTTRGGKATPVITFGHSKDHRPDLKQLVWILTVAADGAVPITYRLADGNTSDDPTHVPTWDELVKLLGRTDFLYVADSKLASTTAMGHINGCGGRFVTVLPRTRKEDEASAALARAGATRWIAFTVNETTEETYRQERRGRPGADTRYRKHTRTRHTISWDTRLDMLAYDAATDGAFPLVTNDTTMIDADVLAAYRYQPNLERRHHLLKATQDADPVLLHNPARIEALFCCHFLALLIGALIEREIRTAMKTANTRHIPLYPELRACPAPAAERILEIFTDLTRHDLRQHGQHVQSFEAELNPLQQQVLDLLDIPTTRYIPARPNP